MASVEGRRTTPSPWSRWGASACRRISVAQDITAAWN